LARSPPDRILEDVVGKVDNLRQAELVALVDVGRTWERQQE
jgi:hypothetical protein